MNITEIIHLIMTVVILLEFVSILFLLDRDKVRKRHYEMAEFTKVLKNANND